jgi:hypothetical protein
MSSPRLGALGLFGCLSPPTPETFIALARVRYRQRLRIAIGHIREAVLAPDHERKQWNLCQASYYLGVADGMSYALYDLNTRDAYPTLKRVDRVGAILGAVRDRIAAERIP